MMMLATSKTYLNPGVTAPPVVAPQPLLLQRGVALGDYFLSRDHLPLVRVELHLGVAVQVAFCESKL
jgi:hypothetical protein